MIETNRAWMIEEAKKDKKYVELLHAWQASAYKKSSHINVVGPAEVHQAFLLSTLLAENPLEEEEGIFLVLPDALQVRRYQEALEAFYPGEVIVFPTREFELSPVDASSNEQMQRRVVLLHKIRKGQRPIVLVPAPALLQPIASVAEQERYSLTINYQTQMSPQALAVALEAMGYERVSMADSLGQFAIRGDIVDLIPIDKPMPEEVPYEEQLDVYGIRISFFDTDVDQIRFFDPLSQRQVAACEEVFLPPAREFLIHEEEKSLLSQEMDKWSALRAKEIFQSGGSKARVEEFRSFIERDKERLENESDLGIIDRYLPLFPEKSMQVLDFLRKYQYRPVVIELQDCSRRMDAFNQDQFQQIQHLMERGKATSLSLNLFYRRSDIFKKLDQEFSCLSMSLLLAEGNGFPGGKRIDIQSRQAENYRGYEDKLYSDLQERQRRKEESFIFVPDKVRRERLHNELLLKAPGTVKKIVPLNLASGFEWPKAGLLVLGTQNVFGQERRKKRRKSKQSGVPIAFFSDLKEGDLVVHEVHGIGRYEGLENLESNGSRSDYIKIRYQDEDVLYLPMSALDQIRRYISTGGKAAKLSKLGGGDWDRLKNRARESIKTLATNLVALYAKRKALKGFAFPENTVWDEEFAENFPYQETEDQLRSIAEIQADMEDEKVMDRLLCGDVGFGKTEVAFRAMFKAINGGKQAALMAPTTVLAQQHYENFKRRTEGFPIKIGHLSRFASPAMQKKTLRGLSTGEIDIVIGTHRILSQDVSFKNLGLLVIDEEQRFGVDDKEKVKDLYPNIDVLSLSATPIPRTLHMSMAGIRDISIIEEPPQERREVQTFVMEYQEDIIADAILREISRGGQIFYLFNNVKKILKERDRIEALVPGCRIAIAHGQMPEQQLEDVIHEFLEGEADLLLCTTIIESGIDMPNVNTLVVTGADRMGLSQLYQLKGRVGRSRRQAYAYVTYDKDKVLNENAQKRLAAIKEYTELGSGFRIALRDLEVRGAGNLLGAEQHGHMEAIGYELYVQMLDEEVKNILAAEKEEKKEASALAKDGQGAPVLEQASYEAPAKVDTVVHIQANAYLPQSLIPDEGQRMDMYRRLAEIENLREYYDILDELTDRYGDLPREAYALADISYIQARAGIMGIKEISIQKENIRMDFAESSKPNMMELSKLLAMDAYKGKVHFHAGAKAHLLWVNSAVNPALLTENLRILFSKVEQA